VCVCVRVLFIVMGGCLWCFWALLRELLLVWDWCDVEVVSMYFVVSIGVPLVLLRSAGCSVLFFLYCDNAAINNNIYRLLY
jgi:hypothetical protein